MEVLLVRSISMLLIRTLAFVAVALFELFGFIDAKVPLLPYKTVKARYKTVRARYKTVKAKYKTVKVRYKTVKARYKTVNARYKTVEARCPGVRGRGPFRALRLHRRTGPAPARVEGGWWRVEGG